VLAWPRPLLAPQSPRPALILWLSQYDAAIQLHSGAPGSLVGTMLAFLVPSAAPLWLDVTGLLGSLVVLAISGDQFVIALARISASVRVRPTVAAALVGGLGTSIAELIVAGVAAAKSPTLAIGSLVGSIVANICLALAVAALIIPLKVDSATVRREAPISVASVVLFAILAVGGVTMAKGLVMLVALGAAVAALLLGNRHGGVDPLGSEMAEFASTKERRSPVESVRAIGMLVFMLGGAEVMVTCSLGVAKHLGFSDGLAGLTLVGIGTSAPLIAASIQAARKGEHDLVVGNVLGGNLFIALGGGAIVGLLASAKSVHVGDVALVLMTVVVVASWLATARGAMLRRSDAIILVLAYAACLPFVNR
jgi:cation:H+ antiporter